MKSAEVKLAFGLNENNVIVHIADVERGKKCGCVCPNPLCRSPLSAHKGRERQHHFKHTNGNETEWCQESAIHLAAKKIIMEQMQILLSEFVSTEKEMDSSGKVYIEEEIVVRHGDIIKFDSVREEKDLHGMTVDILGTRGNKHLIIEVFYRHKVDEVKLQKIITANISAIEINLSDLTLENLKDENAFRSCINEPNRIKWLHNAKNHDSIAPMLKKRLQRKIQEQEEQYEQEKNRKQRQEKREKAEFEQAVDDYKAVSSEEYVERLQQSAEMHPAWKYHSRFLPFSWNELPKFLNVDVPNGDWIFGCDRRIWQTAFYSNYILNNGKSFSVKMVDDWFQNRGGCKVPQCVKIFGKYGMRWPQMVPRDIAYKLPSSWQTLRYYFHFMCELGILEDSGYDYRNPGSVWYNVKRF